MVFQNLIIGKQSVFRKIYLKLSENMEKIKNKINGLGFVTNKSITDAGLEGLSALSKEKISVATKEKTAKMKHLTRLAYKSKRIDSHIKSIKDTRFSYLSDRARKIEQEIVNLNVHNINDKTVGKISKELNVLSKDVAAVINTNKEIERAASQASLEELGLLDGFNEAEFPGT